MKNVTELKNRIKGISDTRKITGAMETISIVKMRRALLTYNSNSQYFDRIRSTMKDIIEHTKDTSHAFLNPRSGKRAVYVVIASDKGLCGGYNHSILNFAWNEIQQHEERYIFTIGQMAREFFEAKKIRIDVEFMHTALAPTISDAIRIVDNIIMLYEQNMMDEVYVVFTALQNAATTVPSVIKLLPLIKDDMIEGVKSDDYKDAQYFKELEYYPSADEVFDNLIPQYLTAVIYGALIQSVASEHSSRMLAMSNATKNADEILEKLNAEYNRARQETITNELAEIIASANSIK